MGHPWLVVLLLILMAACIAERERLFREQRKAMGGEKEMRRFIRERLEAERHGRGE